MQSIWGRAWVKHFLMFLGSIAHNGEQKCSANERCEICPGPGYFGDVTLAYAWGTYLSHASLLMIFSAVKFMYMYMNRSLYFQWSKHTWQAHSRAVAMQRLAHASTPCQGPWCYCATSRHSALQNQFHVHEHVLEANFETWRSIFQRFFFVWKLVEHEMFRHNFG